MLRRATVALLLGGLLAGTAAAQGDDEPERGPDAAPARADATPRREGDYSGVDPDKPASEPDPGKKKVAPGTLTWIGFAADSGEVFFQGSSRFAASQRLEGGALVVEIEGLSKMAPNTRRPLETRFFDTPIARVTARAVRARRGSKKAEARKAGIEVRIAFKDKAKAREGSLRSDAGEGGTYTVHLDMAPQASSSD